MSRALAGLALTASLLVGGASPAHAAHRDRCRHEDCRGDRYGDGGSGGGQGASGGDYEGGKSGDTDQRGDHNCRNFCFYGIPAPGQGGQQPKESDGCLVPVPWHCDQKPASLTDPRKLPAVIAQIAKSGLDMGQLFATTTIKFVEDLFTALA